jgi:4-hydroxyproline epimerase
MALENGLVKPKTPGILKLDTPAGLVTAEYTMNGEYVEEVRITNVPSFLYAEGLTVECPVLGEVSVDVAYGGNFYAIVEPQENFADMADHSAGDLVAWSPSVCQRLNEKYSFVHPENPAINRLSHILWTGKPTRAEAHARNAVFYGDKAIDRSPCGTGTSARMAQLHAKGKLGQGDAFVHESIIGSLFHGRVEKEVEVVGKTAIVPSSGGWARMTGLNTITIDDRDPFAHGFVVK